MLGYSSDHGGGLTGLNRQSAPPTGGEGRRRDGPAGKAGVTGVELAKQTGKLLVFVLLDPRCRFPETSRRIWTSMEHHVWYTWFGALRCLAAIVSPARALVLDYSKYADLRSVGRFGRPRASGATLV